MKTFEQHSDIDKQDQLFFRGWDINKLELKFDFLSSNFNRTKIFYFIGKNLVFMRTRMDNNIICITSELWNRFHDYGNREDIQLIMNRIIKKIMKIEDDIITDILSYFTKGHVEETFHPLISENNTYYFNDTNYFLPDFDYQKIKNIFYEYGLHIDAWNDFENCLIIFFTSLSFDGVIPKNIDDILEKITEELFAEYYDNITSSEILGKVRFYFDEDEYNMKKNMNDIGLM